MGISVSDLLITGISKQCYHCLTCIDNNVSLSFIAKCNDKLILMYNITSYFSWIISFYYYIIFWKYGYNVRNGITDYDTFLFSDLPIMSAFKNWFV